VTLNARRWAPWAVALVVIVAALALRASCSPLPLERLAPSPFAAGDPSGARAYAGSLHLPRGGPYILGVQSPGLAILQIGSTRITANRNVATTRVLLDAGVAPIRVAGPPGTRLVWHPPGRRGDLEYIPASSLSPSPPESAHFDAPGTARWDTAAAWVVLLAIAGAILFTLRARIAAIPGHVLLGTAAVFALAMLVRVWDLGGGGQTWDEDTYWSSGRDYIQNWVRGDFSDGAWVWNYEHPPVSKYLAGLGGLWQDDYGGARAVSAFVMALACATLVAIGARLDKPATGIAAGVVAALTPHLIAHGQIVGHEAPTALAWALAFWTSLRVWDTGATTFRAAAPRLAVCGVVLGVAIMIRYVNVLMAPAIGVTILLRAPNHLREKAIVWGLTVIPLVAVLTSIVLWPRLWTSPLVHLSSSWAKLKGTHTVEPFLGVLTKTPPRYYFFIYLAATAPLGILLASVGGIVAWARARERHLSLAIAAVWFLAPFGVMLSPVRQDGIRYIIPCLLVLALFAGAGITALGALVRRPPVAIAALALYLAIACARIHPYYLDYYGEHVGGPAAVARHKRFEVGWWGEGLEAAITYVNTHAAQGDRVHRECVEPNHLTWFRGDLWETVRDPSQARWIVHYHPSWSGCPIPPNATRVLTVSAQGAPLAYVYRVGP
jgi:4-amino-4-deoxy-L-arabinose transferase-like glycosyltransferase